MCTAYHRTKIVNSHLPAPSDSCLVTIQSESP
jgi:hypothetical protein